MARHRLAFHFVDETATDRPIWEQWLGASPPPLRAVSELGERRPLVSVAAPFPDRAETQTRRDAELTGLELTRALVDDLTALAGATGRAIRLLLSGRALGTVTGAGADAGIAGTLAEWQQLVDARPPDEAEWERDGWLSLWAGTLPRADFDKLLAEHYGHDGPISAFARMIGVTFYDHANLERLHADPPVRVRHALARISHVDSFLPRIAGETLELSVNAAIVMFRTDFSQRPRNAARGRLRYLGSYPYTTP